MGISFCSPPSCFWVIATKFCTWHDSFGSDMTPGYGITLKPIFPSSLNYDGKIVREIGAWSVWQSLYAWCSWRTHTQIRSMLSGQVLNQCQHSVEAYKGCEKLKMKDILYTMPQIDAQLWKRYISSCLCWRGLMFRKIWREFTVIYLKIQITNIKCISFVRCYILINPGFLLWFFYKIRMDVFDVKDSHHNLER